MPNQNFFKSVSMVAILAGLLLAGCQPSNISSMTPNAAAKMFSEQKAIIVDVREDSEWKEGHIAGAIHIPLAQVESRLRELAQYKNSNVVVQCRSGKRSAKAASTLQAAGFTKVYNLTGGIIAWDKDGLATTKFNL
ncbi:MAG: rhodanese-like domain-containing protein [Methylotenera sp.]|nr:rhodanese-like domain-containing protein [Methylotenera sp.]MDP2403411.1 rhodanese-like domain-containing protein [Methylotenera sp.]MDP3095077.1 rhodanese-like domain-containing protein [Methylotenera sp.]MDZ4223922.1 rhodanese-like domain-containing protein [Methylotenera sp.]